MAGVHENAFPTKSSIVAADKLRAIGSDSKSYQALVSDVAKYIVENYNGSTIAGSAQTIQSAVNALNSKFVSLNTTDSVQTTIANLATQRAYPVWTGSLVTKFLTNANSQGAGIVFRANATIAYFLLMVNGNVLYGVNYNPSTNTVASVTQLT